jgi:hypothetical protein
LASEIISAAAGVLEAAHAFLEITERREALAHLGQSAVRPSGHDEATFSGEVDADGPRDFFAPFRVQRILEAAGEDAVIPTGLTLGLGGGGRGNANRGSRWF